jgi:hypothetical protein
MQGAAQMKRLFLALGLLLVQPAWAQQSVSFITRCTSMFGYAYYPQQPLVAKKDSGFDTDKISDGQWLLVKTGEGELDIIFTDATKKTRSSRDSGGKVIPLSMSSEGVVVLVSYEDTLEVFNFRIDSSGTGELIYSQTRFASLIKKSGLYRASCTR